ncbi:MAG: MFS transporter [Chloroflexi bacterium]|nr:MFS transporter [Chloroflexota bacterium]
MPKRLSGLSRQRVTPYLRGGLLGAVATLATVFPVLADEAHLHGAGSIDLTGGPLLWGWASLAGIFAFLILSRFLLVKSMAVQTAGTAAPVGYFATIRQFSRNARLFLAYSLLAGLGTGIWGVMFNLYLLRMGFPVTFIGTFWLVNMLSHGAASLPAGFIADRFGRRRAFFIATLLSVTAQGSLLFTLEPSIILVLAAIAGFGEAFHGVTGAPFMMENSEPQERPHLFSLNASFLQLSNFGGSLAGGLLPLLWATTLGIPPVDPSAARWALVTGLPLTLGALLPLVFMREKSVELAESLKDLITLRYVVHFRIVMQLTLLSLVVGVAFGLTVRFFNIFFQDIFKATYSQVGTILAMGALAGAGSILISPVVAQRWGQVKGILVTQVLSIPLLLMIAFLPSLSAVTVFFLVRGAVYSIGLPLRNQLSMEFIGSKERGTTAGFTHTAFDVGGGLGAGLAGLLITGTGFTSAFTVAATLILVPAILYYVFFAGLEASRQATTRVPAPVPAGRLSTADSRPA